MKNGVMVTLPPLRHVFLPHVQDVFKLTFGESEALSAKWYLLPFCRLSAGPSIWGLAMVKNIS